MDHCLVKLCCYASSSCCSSLPSSATRVRGEGTTSRLALVSDSDPLTSEFSVQSERSLLSTTSLHQSPPPSLENSRSYKRTRWEADDPSSQPLTPSFALFQQPSLSSPLLEWPPRNPPRPSATADCSPPLQESEFPLYVLEG
jgi:hypothetical protein